MQSEVRAIIEHVLADRPGDWRVSIMGSQANDRWELKIMGPNGIHVGHKYLGMANCCEALLRPLLLDAKVLCELLHHDRYVRSAVHGPPTPADEQKYWLQKTQLRITYVQDFSVLRTSLLINRRNHSV